MTEFPKLIKSFGMRIHPAAIVTIPAMTMAAGRMRRTLRIQKFLNENVPLDSSLNRIPVMRKPEITKNTSTPT